MDEKLHTIQEICDLTGYSRRTVRYYIQEGLLEPPAGRGRGGFYYDTHVMKLLEIRALQDRGMKLAAIAEVLRKGGEPEVAVKREVWIRQPVTRGVEIHILRELERTRRKEVVEIVRIARALLEKKGDSDG